MLVKTKVCASSEQGALRIFNNWLRQDDANIRCIHSIVLDYDDYFLKEFSITTSEREV